jgi:Protein of unknown function (DUF1501)
VHSATAANGHTVHANAAHAAGLGHGAHTVVASLDHRGARGVAADAGDAYAVFGRLALAHIHAEFEAAGREQATAQAARADSGDEPHDPGAPDELEGSIEAYELAFRMQGKVPELLDTSRESESVLEAYGVRPGRAGAFARQCVIARRLCKAGVRFVEICQPGWDHNNNLHKGLIDRCAFVDQPTATSMPPFWPFWPWIING